MSARAGRIRAALGALAVLLVATGCTSIPTEGSVIAGTVQDPGAANPIGLFPAEPAEGASPEKIVNGFLAAATGQQDRYRVARLFLAPGLRKTWNPRADVLVTDGGTRIRQSRTAADTVTAAVPVVGRLDAHGAYTAGGSARTTPLRFHLTKVKGQWRIDRAANGIVLGEPVFDRLFEHVTLQYFDPTFRRLYPDLRRFPTRSDNGLATAKDVVDALLAGPSAPLGSGVTASPFPKGTRRAGLSLVGGIATVDLAVPGGAPAAVVQQRMLAQLSHSLVRGTIAQVRLAIGGVPRSVFPVRPLDPPQPNPQPVGLRNRSFGVLEGSRVVSDVLQRAVGALQPSSVTISTFQGLAAVGTGPGVSIVTRTGTRTSVRVVDRRMDLIAPALDPEGWVYSVPRDQPDALVAHDRAGHAMPVAASFPAGAAIRSIEVSPDGSRMLALLETGSGAKAFVAGIVRDSSGRPLRLTAARFPVAVAHGTAVDATWADQGAVATITQDLDGDQVTVQVLGGESSSLGRLTGATDAVGATSRTDLTIRTQNGALSVRQGSVWTPTGVTADVLAVQR